MRYTQDTGGGIAGITSIAMRQLSRGGFLRSVGVVGMGLCGLASGLSISTGVAVAGPEDPCCPPPPCNGPCSCYYSHCTAGGKGCTCQCVYGCGYCNPPCTYAHGVIDNSGNMNCFCNSCSSC